MSSAEPITGIVYTPPHTLTRISDRPGRKVTSAGATQDSRYTPVMCLVQAIYQDFGKVSNQT